MSEEHINDLENWDPDEARAKMDATGLKMPVSFRRDMMEMPGMKMECSDPEPSRTERTAPKIVDITKNKNKLF
jgi:hypothetical protein